MPGTAEPITGFCTARQGVKAGDLGSPLLQEPAEHISKLQLLPWRWSAAIVLGPLPVLTSATTGWAQFSGEGPVKMQMMLCVSSPLERKLSSTIHSTSVTEEF